MHEQEKARRCLQIRGNGIGPLILLAEEARVTVRRDAGHVTPVFWGSRSRPTHASCDSTSPQSTTSTTATTMCSDSRGWIKGLAVALALGTRDSGLLGRRVRPRWIGRTNRPSRVAVGRHTTCASRPNREHASLVDVLAAWAADSPTTSLPISIFASSHVDLIPRSNAASSPMYRRLDGFF
jgi:hypothetical protein